MFRSVFTRTLRDYRVAILGWGGFLALVLYVNILSYATQITTPQAAAGIAQLAETFRFFAEPVAVTTPTGYATWRALGFIPIMLGIWATLAGSRLLRGAEERGTLDIVLATPQPRWRVLAEGIAALVAALALIGALIGLGGVAGEAAAGVAVVPGGALVAGLNVGLVALVFALLALLVSQFTLRAGPAAGTAAGLMVLAYVLDGTGRVAPALAGLGRLTPFHLYGLSKPLIADYGANVGAIVGLVALAALLGAASLPLFARRDVGGVAWARAGAAHRPTPAAALATAARAASLRGVGLRALRANASGVGWWLLGVALFVFWIGGLTRAAKESLLEALADSPLYRQLLASILGGGDAGFLAGILFALLPVLVAVCALTQAAGWARDLDAGRLELVLATPVPRWRAFAEWWGAIVAALVAVPLVAWLAALAALRAWGLSVAAGDLAAAFAGLLPLELVIAGIVALVAGRLGAGAITGAVGALIAASFFAEFLNPLLKLPGWLINLSIFYQYGVPVTDGPRWGNWGALLVLAAALFALGLVRFGRDDLQRGS